MAIHTGTQKRAAVQKKYQRRKPRHRYVPIEADPERFEALLEPERDGPEHVKYLNAMPDFHTEFLPPQDPLLHYLPRDKAAEGELNIKFYKWEDMSRRLIDECFKLVETTSKVAYLSSSRGWHPKEKKVEMNDRDMRYLIIRPLNLLKPIIGFLSFMIAADDAPFEDRPVVYIYEVHLQKELRGKGVGSHLIHITETVGRRCGIEKAMLTVFTSNRKGRKLYEKLGYEKDWCSPSDREVRGRVIEADYKILSKTLEPLEEWMVDVENNEFENPLD